MSEHPKSSADYASFANPLQGTDSCREFSNGNTNPLVALPWGMTHWSLQTRQETGHGSWQYRYGDRKISGIRATHQASPWITDYGHFTLMPVVGEVVPFHEHRSSSFRQQDLEIRPDYLSVYLRRYEINMEMTPTERCATFRFRYPKKADARLLVQSVFGPGELSLSEDGLEVRGAVRGWDEKGLSRANLPEDFRCYFVLRASHPIQQTHLLQFNKRSSGSAVEGDGAGLELLFVQNGEAVEISLATSFISHEQAGQNLANEIGEKSFDELRQAANKRWNEILGRVKIIEPDLARKQTFYSALYRSVLFPRMFHEFDAEQNPIHYSPYTYKVEPGVLSADNGFWDTFRTVYPMLALIYPDELGVIVEGWTNAAKEGGFYPKWASPGYRACMIGTHIDAVVADAMVKDIPGFDREAAYHYVLKNGRITGPAHRFWGRLGLEYQRDLGYVPCDKIDNASSRTLEFAYNDFCIAQVAQAMGDSETEAEFREYANAYQNVYDPEVGLMRGRLANGSWRPNFDPLEWSGPFCEGASIQYSYMVPHDAEGLIALMGGKEKFISDIEKMLAMKPRFNIGGYICEVHEMAEMAAADFGQYAHCNQPSHHILYLLTLAGRPDLANHWLRKVMDELYLPTPDGLAGDEDNGEMSAWYVLTSLGLFSVCPGTPDYVLSCPRFAEAILEVPGYEKIEIYAQGPVAISAQVASRKVNDEAYSSLVISHQKLRSGVRIENALVPSPPQ